MIGTIDIKINAAHPEMALDEVFTFVGSPSSVRIINTPKRIGSWSINKVRIVAIYPDNVSTTVNCVLTGGCWVGTLEAPQRAGTTNGGFQVLADGTDENGDPVVGYVLGIGNFRVMTRSGEDEGVSHLLNLHDEQPTQPAKADVIKQGQQWKVYNGTQWENFGGLEYKAGAGLSLSGDTFALSATIP